MTNENNQSAINPEQSSRILSEGYKRLKYAQVFHEETIDEPAMFSSDDDEDKEPHIATMLILRFARAAFSQENGVNQSVFALQESGNFFGSAMHRELQQHGDSFFDEPDVERETTTDSPALRFVLSQFEKSKALRCSQQSDHGVPTGQKDNVKDGIVNGLLKENDASAEHVIRGTIEENDENSENCAEETAEKKDGAKRDEANAETEDKNAVEDSVSEKLDGEKNEIQETVAGHDTKQENAFNEKVSLAVLEENDAIEHTEQICIEKVAGGKLEIQESVAVDATKQENASNENICAEVLAEICRTEDNTEENGPQKVRGEKDGIGEIEDADITKQENASSELVTPAVLEENHTPNPRTDIQLYVLHENVQENVSMKHGECSETVAVDFSIGNEASEETDQGMEWNFSLQ